MKQSTIPPFAIGGETFRCFVSDDGQRYGWISGDGRCVIGRNPGCLVTIMPDGTKEIRTTHWARVEGKTIGVEFASLKAAMIAAAQSARRNAA